MVGPVNPPSRGYIWILVATEYFTKWARIYRRMGNTPARRPLGLHKITKVCHRIFTLFLGIQDRGSEPSKSDDSIFESYADTGEAKRGKSLHGRKV